MPYYSFYTCCGALYTGIGLLLLLLAFSLQKILLLILIAYLMRSVMLLASFISINISQTFNFSSQQYFTISAFLFQLVCVAYIQNSVKYTIADVVYYIFLSLFLATNSSSRLLNICLSQLANLFYIKNMYYISILIVLIPFSCILVKQGLNHSNTFPIRNNSAQATYFITVSSPSPLLVILILICVRNPFNLQASPK